jgi:hypothetical protein
LTSVEKSLVEHVVRGERLDLAADDEVVDEAAMRSWGDDRTCRAIVIRDILRGRFALDPDPHGLQLRGARISGRLDLEYLSTDVNLQLEDCLLDEGVLAHDACLAAVGFRGCQLEHSTEPPLVATRLTCSTLDLSRARIIGHAERGTVCLPGAHIGSQLDCNGATLLSDSGPGLFAVGLQVGQNMLLSEGFTATGHSNFGTVHLNYADIGLNLECDGASLRNSSGPAVAADGLHVGQNMILRSGHLGRFEATGGNGLAAVRLVGAHIDGNLDCEGASLSNVFGPALDGDSMQVGRSMFLRGGFTATGVGGNGAVRLTGARIGGQLSCNRVDLSNGSGPALNAPSLQVNQILILTGWFTGGGDDVAVDLMGARVGGMLFFDPTRLEHAADRHRRLAVDGLTYAGVPGPISVRDWLDLLRDGIPVYAAQPYRQLAAGYGALGDERRAREILMAQRDDELARGDARWPERLWGRITKVTLGYGYQPWRALLFLAAVVAISCVLAVVLGSHGALAQTDKTAYPGRSCTVVQQVSVGLDLNLPVGTSVGRAGCDLTKDAASVTAAWLTTVGWVLRLLAWVFAALFIAGFTSAVRKA